MKDSLGKSPSSLEPRAPLAAPWPSVSPFMQSTDDNVRYRFENIMERRNPEPRPLR